jgi:hypothetical protein
MLDILADRIMRRILCNLLCSHLHYSELVSPLFWMLLIFNLNVLTPSFLLFLVFSFIKH